MPAAPRSGIHALCAGGHDHAGDDRRKAHAIAAGADDFITKPFDQAELLARVRSVLRIKRYHDTVEAQAAEPAQWNRQLERRVGDQVGELERVGRLRRFLSPQVAGLVVSSGDESFLASHRREITVVSRDLRGFTALVETVEPEDVMQVLAPYHGALGDLIHRFERAGPASGAAPRRPRSAWRGTTGGCARPP